MRSLCVLFILTFSLAIKAQNKQLLYNFDDLPQTLLVNPGAETNFDMHLGLPFLSQIHFSAGSSGVSMYDIFKDDEGSINDRIKESLHKLSRNDFFTVNQQLEIFSIGWRDNKRRYYTAGVYQEMDAILYFPKDPAVLAYEGNKDYIGENFNFSDAAFTADLLNVFHLGFTNYYSEDLNYGFRGKIYSGVFNAHSVGNRGIFRTELSPDAPNLYRHYMSNLDVLIKTAGWANAVNSEASGMEVMNNLVKKAFLGGNLGLGLDAGFTWYVTDQYRITGSVLDIGFMRQTKNVESYRYYGNYQTDGIELLFPGTQEYWDEWEDDLDRNLKDKTLTNSYTTWRPVKFNASVDFGFSENAEPCNCYRPMGRRRYFNHMGAQFFAVKRPRGLNYATTIYYDKTFNENLRGKVTYTADSYSFSNIGFLISAKLSHFNVYLAMDNLLDYTNVAKAQNASIQIGFQLMYSRE